MTEVSPGRPDVHPPTRAGVDIEVGDAALDVGDALLGDGLGEAGMHEALLCVVAVLLTLTTMS